jgi:hypothetical protein
MLRGCQFLSRYTQYGIDTYHTTKGISAAIASSMPAAASGGLVKMSVQVSLQRRQKILRHKDS